MNGPAMSVREACLKASSFLRAAGVDEHERIAEMLIQHVMGWNASSYWLAQREPFPAEAEERLRPLLQRKVAGEPVQYLIGEQEFFGLSFAVDPAVLIPRAETELLVERLLKDEGRLTDAEGLARPLLVADIGTGSGAIPVTLAVRRPHWRFIAVDISPEALRTARANAMRHGVSERVKFLEGDLLAPLEGRGVRPDVLVSNPPYIPEGDLAGLQREVRDYEPRRALDGGEDGLDFYRRIVDGAAAWEAPPRWIGFEVGFGQAADVAQLLRSAGHWARIDTVRDWNGIDRHVIGANI